MQTQEQFLNQNALQFFDCSHTFHVCVQDVQEYGRIGSESEKSIGVLEDGPHAVEEVAQDCSPVTAAIEDTSQLPCQRVSIRLTDSPPESQIAFSTA